MLAKEFNGDVQIELTGWTWEQAAEWRAAGIGQVVYHRSRDAQAAGVAEEAGISAPSNAWRIWALKSPSPVDWRWKIYRFSLKASLSTAFIAGRSIRDAASPVEAARQFKRSIAQLWG